MINKSIGLKVFILPLAAVFAVMFTVLFIQPAYSGMTAKKKAAGASQRQLSDLRQQDMKLSELKAKWDSMEEKKMVQNALPEGESLDDYMSEVYTRVSRSGVLLKSFGTQSQASAGTSETSAYVCGSGLGAPTGDVQPMSGATAAAGPQTPADAAAAPPLCANSLDVSLTMAGTWEQLLTFFQYLGDTNRIANIKDATIKSEVNTQSAESSPDVLAAELTVQLYSYKQKSGTADLKTIGALAGKGGFNVSALQKIKDTVFSAYEEPAVSETGERNVFK